MKNEIFGAFVLGTAMTIMSCSSQEHVASSFSTAKATAPTMVEPITQAEVSAVMTASWSSGCIKDEGEAFSSRTEYHFYQTGLQVIEHQFSDRSCMTPEMDSVITTNLVPVQSGGVYSTKFSAGNITEMTYEILSPELLKEYNSVRNCGYGNWKLNEPRAVHGTFCDIFPSGVAKMRWAVFPDGKNMRMQNCARKENDAMTCTAMDLSKT